MSDSDNKAKEIFWAALDHDGDIRAFVKQTCGEDAELCGRVEELLEAHRAAGDFLGEQKVDATIDTGGSPQLPATVPEPAAPTASTCIGQYKLLEEIGEGGMGTVWVAEQTEPIKRKVAVKLIKAGMDTKTVLARFEAERQALAMMDHPNIARVLDGGVTEQGRPYFAMEYVKGVPLTDYCNQARLSLEDRLNLFVSICNAVQHAHQKGIVHRDLKPSNILVCLYDGKPVPKVIDFGLAKAMHQSLTERTLHTAHGMMVGTPLYMSPEQAESNNLDVDTRTDIYSLGVILYELLTGSTPLEKGQFKEAAVAEILRLIKEVDPPKPSTRLSGSDKLPNVAAQRNIEPARLTRDVTGDLDWVVMKALEKERSRRYETANGLAEDIRRHLADEPVSASPPSTRYRMQKFIKRNRAGVTAAGLIGLALLLGVVGTTSGMFWALLERKDAIVARKAETQAKLDAIANAERALAAEGLAEDRLEQVQTEKSKVEQEKQIAEAVQNFLQDRLLGQADVQFQANTLLAAGREARDINRDVTIRELLDRTAEELSEENIEWTLRGQPQLRAEILFTVADTYAGIGEYDRAIEMFQRVLDFYQAEPNPDPEKKQRVMYEFAGAHLYAGYLDQALPLLTETVKLSEQIHGANHRNTLKSRNGLGVAYRQSGQKDKAFLLFKEVVELSKSTIGPEDPMSLILKFNLAIGYQDNEQPDEAIRLLEEVWEIQKTNLGSEHPQTIQTMSHLGNNYVKIKQFDKGLPMLKESLRLHRDQYGDEAPTTLRNLAHLARVYNNVAMAHTTEEEFEEAIPLFEEALKLSQSASDPLATTTTLTNLAATLKLKNPRRAVTLGEEALDLSKETYGDNHPCTFKAMTALAENYLANQQPDLAQPLLDTQFEFFNSRSGHDFPTLSDDDHADLTDVEQLELWIRTMAMLGTTYGDNRQIERMIPLYERVHEFYESQPGSEQAINAMSYLGCAYCLNQQYELGKPLIEKVYRFYESGAEWDHPHPNLYVDFMTTVYQESGDTDFAMLKESVQIREQRLGPNHPDTLHSMKRLGISYWSTDQFEQAIPIFEELIKRSASGDGRSNAATLDLMVNLAVNYLSAERAEDAISILEECYQTETPFARRIEAGRMLATAYQMAGNFERASGLFNELLNKARKELPPESPKLASILAKQCMALLELERFAESEPLIRECLAIRVKTEPDSWTTYNTYGMLGGALVGQQNYAAAEPLLMKAYEGMDARQTSIPKPSRVRLSETIERLIKLYEATDNEEEASKWRAELETWQRQ